MKLTSSSKIVIYFILLFSVVRCTNEYRHDSDFDEHFENYPSGKPKKRGYWVDKEKSIVENVTYKENGKKHITCRAFADTGAGYCKYWNEDGTLSTYTTIKNHVTTGPYIRFHLNGNVQSSGFYLNGKFDGINISYYEDMRIETLAFFKEGICYLRKDYSENDTSNFSVKLRVDYPETISSSDSLFEINYLIPFIDTLPEMRDSFFVKHDLYYEEEIASQPLHRPRYDEFLERGWVKVPFSKKSDFKDNRDSLIFLTGFLYRKLNEGKIDTLDHFGPLELKIVE